MTPCRPLLHSAHSLPLPQPAIDHRFHAQCTLLDPQQTFPCLSPSGRHGKDKEMSPRLSPLGRAALAATSAVFALRNPARADLVAAVGDLTSGPVLRHLRHRMSSTADGRDMLNTLHPLRFPEFGSISLISMRDLPDGSLGREYARFMDSRGFKPESRAAVRFVDDPVDAWLLQRYRDVHDLWHVLTGMPTTVLGELAQKWFEAAQTGLPVAVMSALVGPLRLKSEDRRVLMTQLVPWAVRCGRRAPDLLAIKYEKRLEDDVDGLRKEWEITVPNVEMNGIRAKR